MLNLSLNELKLIAKDRGTKGYKNKSKDESIEILGKQESKINSLKLRIKEIGGKFNESKDRFSKPKIKEIRRHHNIIENEKKSFHGRNK